MNQPDHARENLESIRKQKEEPMSDDSGDANEFIVCKSAEQRKRISTTKPAAEPLPIA